MVRFLHTADWQLGMKGATLGKAAEKVRKVRMETARALLVMAKEEKVDFVLIVGDLFESNAISREIVEQVLGIFEEASDVPIYILPGNHDPLEPDSIYLQRLWKSSPSHVKVLTERKPIKLDQFDTILYPCPLYQKQSRVDPTEWIPKQNMRALRIGVAHGTLDIGITKEPNFPISPHRVEESNLDYLALGDWHSLFIHKDSSSAQRTIYPGTPEATSFDEKDPGHVIIVEISKGEEPKIEERNCARLRWKVWEELIDSEQDIQALVRKVKKLGNGANTLIRVVVKGAVDIPVYNMAEGLAQLLKGDLLHVDVDLSKLRLKPSTKRIVGIVPEGTLRKVAESLEALLSRQPGFSRLVEAPPEELEGRLNEIEELKLEELKPATIQRALSLLYQLSKEVVG